jgi:hypothetical protein
MKTCPRCKLDHEDDPRACPAVKAIEVNVFGQVTRIEYLTPLDYPPPDKAEAVEPDYPRLPKLPGGRF